MAVWRGKELLSAGSISGGSGKWMDKCARIVESLHITTRKIGDISGMYYEQPVSRDNAATAKQDITKLTMVSGMLCGLFGAVYNIKPEPVEILHWKGQLPKEVVKQRVLRRLEARGFELTTKASHEYDAIGIGLHVLGEM